MNKFKEKIAYNINILFLLLIGALLLSPITHAKDRYKAFAEVGLPEEIPNFLLSSLSHDSAYIEHVLIEEGVGTEKTNLEVFLLFSKDKNNNIDLRAKYDEFINEDEERLIDSLKTAAKTQYRIKNYGRIYDPASIEVKIVDERTKHVFIKFSPYALPQDIAYFRHMVADFTIEDGKLTTAVVKNTKPFVKDGKHIESYEMTTKFLSKNDKYFLDNKTVVAEGMWGDKAYYQKMNGNFVAYYSGRDSVADVVLNDELLTKASNPRLKEAKMELNRALPFMADMVRQQGIDLPLPFGVAVNYRTQENDFDFTSFSVLGIPPESLEKLFDPATSTAKVKVESLSLKADMFILPFWNVFAVLGQNKTSVDMQAHFKGVDACLGITLPNGSCLGESVQLPSTDIPISLDLTYETLGLGTTLAVGYKNVFASMTATYAHSSLKDSASPATTMWIFSPMIGYQFTEWRAQVLVGAEYQDYAAKMTGVVGELDYDIGIESDKWSYTLGARKELGQHYNLIALASRGNGRTSFTLSAEYRF
ncbi:hypothetical protein [Colwellia sp. RSH04]|uniref:hypothetical protein n=1 Tax=Colwellia sp. RSH04 TaxID=2305464 RepID=UPI000E580BB3|nr:hypothetical protein [Colwellia sp. RSH04]RHW75680.1 hypothetical protein D1094_11115 [Colwellia sp. RSH04]